MMGMPETIWTAGDVPRKRVRVRALGLACVVVAGCGDGGSGGTTPPEPPDPPRPTAISVSPTSVELTALGETATFTASVTDQYGAAFNATVAWSGDAPEVFSISAAGVATAVGNGAGTVTATFQGLVARASVAVNANRAPEVGDSIPDVALVVGGVPASVDMARAFSDPDGDSLTFGAVSADTTVAAASVDGSVVAVSPVGEGTATITVTATDPDGLSAQQAFAVVVEGGNRAPEAVGGLDAVVLAAGGAPVGVDAARAFSDPDGDSLTFGAVSADTTVASASVDGSVVAVSPVGEGTTTITVTATDPGGLSAQQAFAVVVEGGNRAPEAVGAIPALTLPAGGDSAWVKVGGAFSDPDGDALAFSAVSADTAVVTVDVLGDSAIVRALTKGETTVTVTAEDPGGLFAQQAFAVVVEAEGYRPMQGVRVFKGRIEIAGISLLDCFPVGGITLNGVTYTVHTSNWQRRDDAMAEWTALAGTEQTGQVCPYSTDAPGEYRLVGDLTIDGVRGLYRSENTFVVSASGDADR